MINHKRTEEILKINNYKIQNECHQKWYDLGWYRTNENIYQTIRFENGREYLQQIEIFSNTISNNLYDLSRNGMGLGRGKITDEEQKLIKEKQDLANSILNASKKRETEVGYVPTLDEILQKIDDYRREKWEKEHLNEKDKV